MLIIEITLELFSAISIKHESCVGLFITFYFFLYLVDRDQNVNILFNHFSKE